MISNVKNTHECFVNIKLNIKMSTKFQTNRLRI